MGKVEETLQAALRVAALTVSEGAFATLHEQAKAPRSSALV
jgi:hypothetical protein